ncbi:MAG: hypothetical protein AAGA94_06055 [Pseudomonadota bacterium]
MGRTLLLAAAATLALAGAAQAQVKAFGFSMKPGSTEVKGTLVVDGYTLAQMRGMMGKYCQGGQIGDITYTGNPRKRRGMVLQKFKTTCAGGPLSRLAKGRSSYEIEFITKGEYKNQHLVEITTSDGKGNVVYLREAAQP